MGFCSVSLGCTRSTDHPGMIALAELREPTQTNHFAEAANNGGHIFISYSRKDFYFAESLSAAFEAEGHATWLDAKNLEPGHQWKEHLEAGLQASRALVLVATKASLSSAAVEYEYLRALAQEKPVIVALWQRIALPPKLSECHVVDCRGSFQESVGRLLACVESRDGSPATASGSALWRPKLPRDVLLFLFCLAGPAIFFLLVSNYLTVDLSLEDRRLHPYVQYFGMVLLVIFWLWFFAVSFLRRSMGMTRLAIALSVLSLVYLEPVLRYLLAPIAGACGSLSAIDDLTCQIPAIPIVLGLLPFAAVVYLASGRSEDLLRWTPTGKAWPQYRRRSRADLGQEMALIRSSNESQHAFTILADPCDSNCVAQLKTMLSNMGLNEALATESSALNYLLITSNTPLSTIRKVLTGTPGLVPVVCSPINVPDELDPLWRLQWFDLRGLENRSLIGGRLLGSVPEALSNIKLPISVFLAHQAICSITSLHFLITGGISNAVTTQAAQASQNVEALAALHQWLCAIGLICGIFIAGRFLSKRLSSKALFISLTIWLLFCWITIFIDIDLIDPRDIPPRIGWIILGLLLGLSVCAVKCATLSRSWLPLGAKSRQSREPSIGFPKNYRTIAAFALHALVWHAFVGKINYPLG